MKECIAVKDDRGPTPFSQCNCDQGIFAVRKNDWLKKTQACLSESPRVVSRWFHGLGQSIKKDKAAPLIQPRVWWQWAMVGCYGVWSLALAHSADNFPQRPIRIVVGFTPGGGPDITARSLALRLSEHWHQPVIIDNRPAAGGILAASLVAHTNPDGYTWLSVSTAHAVAPALYAKLPFDPLLDLSAITQTSTSKYVLVVPVGLGIKSIKELIALAKSKPGELNFSSAGVGSGTHFAAELFNSMAGVRVSHVPMKGIPEAMTETIAGRVQFFMAPIASAMNLVKDMRLVALGVSSPKRDVLLPDLPTIAETGLNDYQSELWSGLLTTAKVPRGLIQRLNEQVGVVLAQPELAARWSAMGLEPRHTTPGAFDHFIATQITLFTRIAKQSHIRVD